MTQTASQSAIPAAPAAPRAPGAAVVTSGTERIFTRADIDALQSRKEELSRLLNSASHRRKQTQDALRDAVPGADRAGLEQRLGVLDGRIARLEQEIDENSSQLASLGAQKLTTSVGTPMLADGNWQPGPEQYGVPIAIAFILVVLGPIAFATARNIWRRGARAVPVVPSGEHAERLERIEHAVDAIAIEVERVSEGQRFVTRLMSEQQGGSALHGGEGAMAPVRVGEPGFARRS